MSANDEWDQTVRGACPMGDLAHCPLYIESHNATGLGCVDDMARSCKVKRSTMDFQNAILELARRGIAHPGMIQSIRTVGGRH